MELKEIKKRWNEFSNIPINNNDTIERDFYNFKKGTNRFDVWKWFDEVCPNGVAFDLIGKENDNAT